MKHIFLATCIAVLLSTTPLAAETVEGVLMDKMCSGMVAEKGFAAAKMHTKECALMPNCSASGYGVVTEDGKFVKFNKKGDKPALEALAGTGVNPKRETVEIGTGYDSPQNACLLRCIVARWS